MAEKEKKLSKRSIFVFEQFIKYLPELKLFHPSLFLTLEGNLSLGWENKNGHSIEVEFYPDKLEYYIENGNEESEVKLLNIFSFAERIKQILR